ncbi:MAG: hypothetical protein HYW24_05110 [Candidatus Aenigmarchaeota archaeon]|nr:hypothetical protein [Candidatus Aenigmarchaeota archaeon]
MIAYKEQMKQLELQLDNLPHYEFVGSVNPDLSLTKKEMDSLLENGSIIYKSHEVERPYKRRIIVHTRSYYLPDIIRGMTDTVKNIWINAKEYYKSLVLRHEKIHVAHPEWPESVVRQFHESYEPFLPDVEFVYV